MASFLAIHLNVIYSVLPNQNVCQSTVPLEGIAFSRPNLMHIRTPNASACAEACCDYPACGAYTFTSYDPNLFPKGDNCSHGAPCCFLKTISHSPYKLTNCTSGEVVRPPKPTPHGGGSCKGLSDCSFTGDCVNGSCKCDVSWTGAQCDRLNLLPAKVGAGYPFGNAPSAVPTNWTFTWGGAVVRDPESPTPLFHGFFTEYLNHCPMTYGTWSTSTQIRHATSKNPQGPYTPLDVAVPTAAGNPVITRAPDGTWLLYFTNERWTGGSRNCTGPLDSWGPPIYCSSSGHQCETGISLAYSKSLSGPWTLQYNVAKFSCTNPGAPVFAPNGSLVMGYKTWTKKGRCIGVVAAQSWRDWPYDTFPLGSVDSCIAIEAHVEDPSNLWRDHRGNIHMLVHQDGVGGAAHSVDGGRSWAFNPDSPAYPYTVDYEDGSTLLCSNREEPKVLLDPSGQYPTMLINVCRLASSHLPNTAPTSAFPNGEAQYVTKVVMQPIG